VFSFASRRTFVLANILESICTAIVFPLYDANFAKGALAYDAEETEVIEVYCNKETVSTRSRSTIRFERTLLGKDYRLALLVAHVRGRREFFSQACSVLAARLCTSR
jgi:hypothetical protein